MSTQKSTTDVPARTSRASAYLMLIGMIGVWSLNWVIIKKAVVEVSPLIFTSLRFFGAAIVTTALCRFLRQPCFLSDATERGRLVLVGLFSMAGNLTCLAVGLQYAEAGRGAVLAYTMQMWAVPLGYYLNRDRVSGAKVACGLLAFFGTLLLLSPHTSANGTGSLFGYLILTAAAVNWAVGSCLYRKYRWVAPFWTQINVQLWASAVAIAIAAVILERNQRFAISGIVVFGLFYNWVLGTGLCYWWWSRILKVMTAAEGGLVLCAIPLAAIVLSVAIFGEKLQPVDFAGIALVLVGVGGALITDIRHTRKIA